MLSDVRYAVRCLRKSPLFSIVVSLTLALGIGATTAVFSLVDAVLLRTLPVPDPEALFALENVTTAGVARGQFSYPTFEALWARQDAFSGLFARSGASVHIGDGSEREPAMLVSGEFFSTLGVTAHLGRTITTEDLKPTPRNVAVISFQFWERRLGLDPDVLGRTLLVEDTPTMIVGVAPPDFLGLNIGTSRTIYLPISMISTVMPGAVSLDTRRTLWTNLIGRLKTGVTMAQAQAQLDSIWPRALEDTVPLDAKGERRTRFLSQKIRLRSASRGESRLRRDFSTALLFLMAVTGLFFVLACCNIAGLLLARGMAREKEMAIRLGLGASRWRLIRQLLIESLLLSIPGSILGLALGNVGARLFLSLLSQRLGPIALDLSIDYRILLFVLVLSLLNGVAFGLLPAWRTTGPSPNALLKGEMHQGERDRTLWRPSRIVVSVQMGLSLLLLIVAGLLLRTFVNLSSVDLGFPRDGLLSIGLNPKRGTSNPTSLPEYYRQLLEGIRALPGVRSASLMHTLPLTYRRMESFSIRGREARPEEETSAYMNYVGSDFFPTLGLPVKEGRGFGSFDRETTRRVAVINESMAREVFPSGDAVGSFIGIHPDPEENQSEIIGVVADTLYRDVRERGSYAIYLSCFQNRYPVGMLIRAFSDPRGVEVAARGVIDKLGKHEPVFVRTFTERMDMLIYEEEVVAMLSSFFSLSALVLAAMGLYALMAYTVTRRTYEIGVRIALGAKRANVQWLILRDALRLAVIGVALGVLGALATSRTIDSMLFGLTPTDPQTLSFAAAGIFLISMCAAIIPAARAARLDPVKALRYE